jgi:hypothetical protein
MIKIWKWMNISTQMMVNNQIYKINKEINDHKYNWKVNGNVVYDNEVFVSTFFSKEKEKILILTEEELKQFQEKKNYLVIIL